MKKWGELANLPHDAVVEILNKELKQFCYYGVCRDCEEWKFTNKFSDCEACNEKE
jgi:hypothetical protein